MTPHRRPVRTKSSAAPGRSVPVKSDPATMHGGFAGQDARAPHDHEPPPWPGPDGRVTASPRPAGEVRRAGWCAASIRLLLRMLRIRLAAFGAPAFDHRSAGCGAGCQCAGCRPGAGQGCRRGIEPRVARGGPMAEPIAAAHRVRGVGPSRRRLVQQRERENDEHAMERPDPDEGGHGPGLGIRARTSPPARGPSATGGRNPHATDSSTGGDGRWGPSGAVVGHHPDGVG
jgi:hypothetical protein